MFAQTHFTMLAWSTPNVNKKIQRMYVLQHNVGILLLNLALQASNSAILIAPLLVQALAKPMESTFVEGLRRCNSAAIALALQSNISLNLASIIGLVLCGIRTLW